MGNVQVQQQFGGEGGDGCGGGGDGGGRGGRGQIMEVKAEKNKEEKPKEIVLKVYMHCEGCGAKVSKCLKGLQGIEEIKTDVKHNRVIVKGPNADPLKVLERIKKKYSKHAELLYPKPKLKAANDNKEVPKKQEPQTKVIVLKMYIHCEGCANDIKKYIERMKGILYVEPDMKKSTVTIRGVFDPQKLVETITKKLGKYAEIVGGGSNDEAGNENGQDGNEKAKQEEIMFHYPPQCFVHYIYPAQNFSDENVFSCSIM